MKKVFLDIGFDYDFLLLGIVSQEKAHRLVWFINKELQYHFCHAGVLRIFENDAVTREFTRYEYADEINHLQLYLIENKDESACLLPELRHVDYFMMIKGALDFLDLKKMIRMIKPLEPVQLVTKIDHHKLRSKQNLIF